MRCSIADACALIVPDRHQIRKEGNRLWKGEKLANPGPLGLMGFGATTVLLNIHNAGFFPIGSLILAMGIFYGGIAQIIAGILEFKKGNTFGLTAFASFGSFWLTLVFIIVFKDLPGNSPAFMGWYLFVWGVFTFFMWIGTFGKNRVPADSSFFLYSFSFGFSQSATGQEVRLSAPLRGTKESSAAPLLFILRWRR